MIILKITKTSLSLEDMFLEKPQARLKMTPSAF